MIFRFTPTDLRPTNAPHSSHHSPLLPDRPSGPSTLSHQNPSYKTPIHALKGFKRIHLKVGESKKITFKLTPKELSVIDEKGNSLPIKGKAKIFVGGGQPLKDTLNQFLEITL